MMALYLCRVSPGWIWAQTTREQVTLNFFAWCGGKFEQIGLLFIAAVGCSCPTLYMINSEWCETAASLWYSLAQQLPVAKPMGSTRWGRWVLHSRL